MHQEAKVAEGPSVATVREAAKKSLESAVWAACHALGRGKRVEAAYALANALHEAKRAGVTTDDIYDILGDWDWDGFVFSYTHFDNLSSFTFFRRS